MRKLIFLSCLILAIIALSGQAVFGQMTWESLFEKTDKFRLKGQYEKTRSKLKTVQKLVAKKLGNAEVYQQWLEIYTLGLANSLGELPSVEQQRIEIATSLAALVPQQAPQALYGWLKLSDVLIEQGVFRRPKLCSWPRKKPLRRLPT
ncbi:MAG: hypothetical protein HC913_04020 [Microscillaceae bacterium]|nr:hypothetical protein [Microscillaceae bacterium]